MQKWKSVEAEQGKPFIGFEGMRPSEITFSWKIVQKSRKRCVTKYKSSTSAETT